MNYCFKLCPLSLVHPQFQHIAVMISASYMTLLCMIVRMPPVVAVTNTNTNTNTVTLAMNV